MRYNRRAIPVKKITIVIDDREKQGWKWLSDMYPVKTKRLKAGDYSIEGYEDKVSIEKKSGIPELLSNLTNNNRSRFERFLARLSKYPVKAIVVCEPLTEANVRYHLSVLYKKTRCRLTEQTIYFWLARITIYYKIPIIFAGPLAVRNVVSNMFTECKKVLKEL